MLSERRENEERGKCDDIMFYYDRFYLSRKTIKYFLILLILNIFDSVN